MFGSYHDHDPVTSAEKRRSSRIVLIESSGQKALERMRLRLFCVGVVFGLCFLSISGRLFEVAVLRDNPKAEITSIDDYRALKPRYARADILDRNGEVLATTLATASLYANPRQIRRPVEVAEQLAKILPDMNEKDMAKRLSSGKTFVWVKRHLSPRQQKQVNDLGIPGLEFESEFKRIYPHGNLFSHVLGYVDVDSKGISGIEKSFDEQLRNADGRSEPVVLSMDMRVQEVVREEMSKSVAEFQAKGATGVVMDVRTGEIVAMNNLPDFDPHEPGKSKDENRFNRATLGVYEMGSTFKTFTMAVALESGVANMQTSYDASKPIRVARFTINDSHPENRWLTVPEIFALSSNIGTVKMILDVGTARQQEFLRKLGMFEPVEYELPERASPLMPSPWREINTMTISYGHGIAVTPIHLVRAMATIVGTGQLMPVTLLKGGNDKREPGAQVMSPTNVANMRKLLRIVVEQGTGKKGNAEGYRVGGKTGTAEKQGAGGYYKDQKLALFVSAFPMDDPRYVVLVMVDEPKGNKSTYGFATGGWISAPVVGTVINRIGPMLGVRPMFELPNEDRKKEWRDAFLPVPQATESVYAFAF